MTQLKSPDLLDNEKNSLFEIMCQIMYAALPLILCFELIVLPAAINAYIIGITLNIQGIMKDLPQCLPSVRALC